MRYACKILFGGLIRLISHDIDSADYSCITSISYMQRLHLPIANIYKRYNGTSYSLSIVCCSPDNIALKFKKWFLKNACKDCGSDLQVVRSCEPCTCETEQQIRMRCTRVQEATLHRDAKYTADMKYAGNKGFR